MTDNSGPAFPVSAVVVDTGYTGLTLRKWFAGMAMQGMLANSSSIDHSNESIAEDAFNMADAMIEWGEK